jgi:hypothetical protein
VVLIHKFQLDAVFSIGIPLVDHEYEVLLLHPTNMSHDYSLGFPVRVGVFFQPMPLVSSVGGRREHLAPMENSCKMRSGIGHGWSPFETRNIIMPRHFEVYLKISYLKTDALLYYTSSLRCLVMP